MRIAISSLLFCICLLDKVITRSENAKTHLPSMHEKRFFSMSSYGQHSSIKGSLLMSVGRLPRSEERRLLLTEASQRSTLRTLRLSFLTCSILANGSYLGLPRILVARAPDRYRAMDRPKSPADSSGSVHQPPESSQLPESQSRKPTQPYS